MKVESNSPLQKVPNDYCPAGSDRWFEIPAGLDKGKKLFFSDYAPDDGEPEKTVLFVHGNPECSYTYRHVRDHLIGSKARVRIVSPDHIGFGVSDQASLEMVDMHHAENLRMLIEHLDLRHVILVIHDWGGPIGVGAFLGQMDRVEGLVVLNTTVFPMPSDGHTYANWPAPWMPWCSFGWLVPDMFWGGVAANALESANPGPISVLYSKSMLYQLKFALRLIPEGTPAYVFSESLRSRMNAKSSKRNVLQTPRWGHGYSYNDRVHGVQDNHSFYSRIQEQVPKFWGAGGQNIPAAAHIGAYDPCGKNSVLKQWQEAIPSLEENSHVYADIGHFVEEYKGEEIARSIIEICNHSRVESEVRSHA